MVIKQNFLNRGIHEGCPVSALLFILVVEVLADKLKTSCIEGIMYIDAKQEIILSRYADDMAVFLRDDKQLATVIDTVSEFRILADPMINKDKTEGIWLGKQKVQQSQYKCEKIKWPKRYIGENKVACDNLNWWSKLREAEKMWKILGKGGI